RQRSASGCRRGTREPEPAPASTRRWRALRGSTGRPELDFRRAGFRHLIEHGKTRDRTNAIGPCDLVKPPLVGRQRGAVVFRIPQMEDAGREISVLATYAAAEQPDHEVGILEPPASIGRIEAIHPVEVAAPDREIAGTRAPPRVRSQSAQRAE